MLSQQPLVTIEPSNRFHAADLLEVWHYRDLLVELMKRDIRLRYRQTALGVIWVVLQPLLGAIIFSVVGKAARLPVGDVPMLAYSFASLLAWNLFQAILTKSGNCLVGNTQLVSKIFFPRLILPLSVVPGALLDALIATVVFSVIAVILGVKATAMLVLFPIGMLGIMLLAIGAGILVSALTVPYRDVQHILPVLVQLLFWGSPVIVPASLYTGKLVWFMLLNPMSGYLELVRASLLGTTLPSGNLLAISIGTTIVMLITGITVFRSMERTFADII